MRARLTLAFVGLAALLVLAFLLAPVDFRQVLGYAANNPFGMVLALLAYTGAFVLRAFSWRRLLWERVPLRGLFALIMGALFLNHIAPAKAGDIARMYALAKRGVAGERAVASVVLGRLVDLVGLLVVLTASLAFAGAGRWETVGYAALVVLGMIVALLVLFRLNLFARFGDVGRQVDRLRGALRETTPSALLRSLAFAIPAWVLEAGILSYVGRGLGLELSPAQVLAATCFAILVSAVPLAPSALGTYEAGMVAILVLFGVPANLASPPPSAPTPSSSCTPSPPPPSP
ncbi:MAG TPA: lysylphosphatidylglycerol synthase transmembrane domain-containing protein [Rubrobacteraceae bacterium]|nr:lysylphosphatidylglycerol synthase transmembrane domain-containing protein [Rubrobacteraceae bacterium]